MQIYFNISSTNKYTIIWNVLIFKPAFVSSIPSYKIVTLTLD